MDIIKRLKEANLFKKYTKDIKGIKYGFLAMLFSSSFVFSLGLLHTYKGLEEDINLYLFSLISFIFSFIYKSFSLKTINKQYLNKLNS